MAVPLVENNEYHSKGADYFVRKEIENIFEKGEQIDVLLLACTHYPLLREKIEEHIPVGVKLLSQGEIVARSLADYLRRHPEIAQQCSQGRERLFYTTDATEDFDNHATTFFGEAVQSQHTDLV